MRTFLIFLAFILINVSCQPTEAPKESVVITEPEMAQENSGEPTGPHTSAEWKIWAYSTAAPSFIAANCTCLLYTSPSPRDGLLSRMPSSA